MKETESERNRASAGMRHENWLFDRFETKNRPKIQGIFFSMPKKSRGVEFGGTVIELRNCILQNHD
jgi:hypothetical protein